MRENKMIKKYEYVIESSVEIDNVICLSEYVNNHIKITLSDNRVIRVFDNKDNDMNIIELTDNDDNVTVLL
jgi:methyltransferase-like protein